jgi:hypothetical protein
MLRWPDEAAEVTRLRGLGVPRLLLVAVGAEPPAAGDCLEDWVQLPAGERELQARLSSLRERAAAHRPLPRLDTDGRLFHDGDWVALSPVA